MRDELGKPEDLRIRLNELMKEADELTAILVTCVKNTKQRKRKK
jgi:hypothetical protein